MKIKKNYIYLAIFIILIVIILGSKVIFNNTLSSSSEMIPMELNSKSEEIKVTFVELGSVGCIPCDKMQPIMKEIEEKYKGQVEVVFYDVKTAEGEPYKKEFNIRAIPTQVFLDKEGNEYYRHLGFFAKDEIIKVLQKQGVN